MIFTLRCKRRPSKRDKRGAEGINVHAWQMRAPNGYLGLGLLAVLQRLKVALHPIGFTTRELDFTELGQIGAFADALLNVLWYTKAVLSVDSIFTF